MPYIRITLEKVECRSPRNWSGDSDSFYIQRAHIDRPEALKANAISMVKGGIYYPTRKENVIFNEVLADDAMLSVTLRALTTDEPEDYPLGEVHIDTPVRDIMSEKQEWSFQGTFLGSSWDYTVTFRIEKKYVFDTL